METGELYETRLADVASSIRAYRRIFDDIDKTHEAAIEALGRISSVSRRGKT